MPKSGHSNEMVYRKPIINWQKVKNVTQRDVEQFSMTSLFWVMEVFLEPVLPFFG